MFSIDSIRLLASNDYSRIGISETASRLSFFYSECDSYANCLSDLKNENFIINDDDYEYVANFLKDINTISPIRVILSNKELGERAYRIHYAYLKTLLSDRDLEFSEDSDCLSSDIVNVFVDIVATRDIQSRRASAENANNCIYFTFIIEKDTDKDDEGNNIPETVLNSFIERTKKWPVICGNLPFKSLYRYVPLRCKTPEESTVIEGERHLLYTFKDGKLDWSDTSVLNILATEIEDVIFQVFESACLPYVTWFCIPPYPANLSSLQLGGKENNNDKYKSRFALLSDRVCAKLKMKNGLDTVRFDNSGSYFLNKESLVGANVILFDDIVTTGKAVQRIKTELENLGANVLLFISVAKTEINNPG